MKTTSAIAAALSACATLAPLTAAAQVTGTPEPFTNELARRLNGSPALLQKFVAGATATSVAQVPASLLLNGVGFAGNVVQVGVATLDKAPVVSAASAGQYPFTNCGTLPTSGTQSATYQAGTTSTATWTDTKSLTINNTLNLQSKFPGGQVQDTLTTSYNDTQTKGTSTTNSIQQTVSAAATFWVKPGTAIRLDFSSTHYDLQGSPVTYQVKPDGTVSATLASKSVSGKSVTTFDGTYGLSSTALPGWIPLTYGGKSACAWIVDSTVQSIGTIIPEKGACEIVAANSVQLAKIYTPIWIHPALEWESTWSQDTKVPTGSPYPTWAQGLPCVDSKGYFGISNNQASCLSRSSNLSYTPSPQNGKMLRYRQSGLTAVSTSTLEQADPQGLVVPVSMTITALIAKNDATSRVSEIPVDPPCAK